MGLGTQKRDGWGGGPKKEMDGVEDLKKRWMGWRTQKGIDKSQKLLLLVTKNNVSKSTRLAKFFSNIIMKLL
jgi:hypothetical protein